MTNTQLWNLIKLHQPPPKYETIDIATKYGHTVIWTPPYHPELQEIEVIWAVGKNWCKMHPAQSFAELKVNAKKAFTEHVEKKTWVGVHSKVVEWEDHYIAEQEHDQAYVAEEADEGAIEIASDNED